MKNLTKPYWIFIFNTIPNVFLFIVFLYLYDKSKVFLSGEELSNIFYWTWIIGVLTLINLIYALFLMFTGRRISFFYVIMVILVYSSIIIAYFINSFDLFFREVPSWILPQNTGLYIATFLMPAIIHGLLIVAGKLSFLVKNRNPLKEFFFMTLTPIGFYILAIVFFPLVNKLSYKFRDHVENVFVTTGIILSVFFLLRWGLTLLSKNRDFWKENHLAWKIPFVLIFPMIGLLLNSVFDFYFIPKNLFGDFSSLWFFFIAFFNGILLIIPANDNKIYRFVTFVLKGITLTFSLYFFIVFLPYLPLSILLILLFGIGFLMLTPLVIFPYHIKSLYRDYNFLKKHFASYILIPVFILSFAMIPSIITYDFLQDKAIINSALQYIHDEKKLGQNFDIASLKYILKKIKNNKYSYRMNDEPYILPYYNWLVLDNLTLSDKTIKKIDAVFFNNFKTKIYRPRRRKINTDNVNITDINVKSVYNPDKKYWISKIDFEITNSDTIFRQSEYKTEFTLPEGCWISDYYLKVGDKIEKGLLTERNTALWIYNRIKNKKLDPGILYYKNANTIAFDIFPFVKKEIRQTGIEFIHKEPVQLDIDNHIINLGEKAGLTKNIIKDKTGNVYYIPAAKKAGLRKVMRKPYYHFIIDISANNQGNTAKYISTIKDFLAMHPIAKAKHKISFTNYAVNTIEMDRNWENNLKNAKIEGGFYLDRAIKNILRDLYKKQSDLYPEIIVVTEDMNRAIIENNFSTYGFTYPESDIFYELSLSGNIIAHSLSKNPLIPVDTVIDIESRKPVLKFMQGENTVYLPDNNQASIIVSPDSITITDIDNTDEKWQSGLTMEGIYKNTLLYPANKYKMILPLIKGSFRSKLMNPYTSYIVVETEAQKKQIKYKQKQILSNVYNIDTGDEIQHMSEPSIIVVMIILLLWLLWHEKVFWARNRKIHK